MRVVRAYSQEPHELARFRAANDEYVRRNRGLIRLQGMFYPSMTLFLGFGALLVLWLGSREVDQRTDLRSASSSPSTPTSSMLSWPMIAFGWVTNILQRGMASWKRMLEVLDAQPAIDDRAVTPAGRAVVIRGAIEIRHLTFTYPTANVPALDRVSLSIGAGQTVAIVGATGSGKSTLVNLLPRLHEPPPGTVFLDGVDVREIPLADPARGDRLRAAGAVSVLGHLARQHRVRRGPSRGAGADRRSRRGARAAAIARLDKDVATFPEGLRHARRRARHHAVGRAEAAHRHRPRRC